MNPKFKVKALALVVTSFMSHSAFSANENASVIRTESGVDITPGLNTALKYDDNIASSNDNKQDSWILTVTPAVKAELLDGNNAYSVEAGLEYAEYFDSSDDNYLDFLLKANGDVEINQSNKFNLNAMYINGHDDRGTGIFAGAGGVQDEPNTYELYSVGGYYEYGARGTPARVQLNAKYFEKQYTNFKSVTQYRNYNDVILGATFFYDTQSSSSFFLELKNIDTSYDELDPTGDRDSQTQNAKLGMSWEATSTTEGHVKVGYQNKSFDNSDREDFSGIAWDAKLTWKPLTYSQFDFTTGRDSKDPNSFGDYVKETNYGVKWKHEWSDFLASTVAYTFTNEEYTGVAREDDTSSVRIALEYAVTRWLLIKPGVDFNQNSSTEDRFDYDRNVYFIRAEMTM
ncbi:hypothetical protein A9267_00745 [Shewanella sp. UCD-FRSSP16_17]|uniref:outer membrane beta-barrel protein n=1 Tax=unclassified Shewanella TaxID=196818 RepID=UPI0007EEBB33|nr:MULTISPECIES: outer membrane beta-barrel protein [unclassified Shewanella]MBQ4889115.1 outer membrane beta-barrel protein [Shewanella sp. MMG014]OBT11214.1 hypothetical protein A9267_00745 [Shewanella sp. UCD-FRSSP16_17]